MDKKYTFLDSPDWTAIVNNIKGVMTSDSTITTLMDFERVLDEADIYAFKNCSLGELVDGPVIKRYDVTCTFMWPKKLMPDPRGAKRLLPLGCKIEFKKTKIKVPIEIKEPDDFKAGTHYPKMITREVWLVNIVMPKELMNDIREGSVDIAEQTIDLEDLDDAYSKDYDTDNVKDKDAQGSEGPGSGIPPAPGGPTI
jgi:hypothetical protein